MSGESRDLEEEYFAKADREKIAALKAKREAEEAVAAAEARKQLHHHKCGKCGGDMDTKPFRGVEIEICATCGSVLLDPGELEQLAGTDQSGTARALLNFFGRD